MVKISKKIHSRITRSDVLDRHLSDLEYLIYKIKGWKKGAFGANQLVKELIDDSVAVFTKVSHSLEPYIKQRNLYALAIDQKYKELIREYESPRKEETA